MDVQNNFNGYDYFSSLAKKNKLARKERFKFCRVTGLGGLEEVLQEMKKEQAFFAVDETADGSTFQKNGGWYKRRVYTVFLLKRYRIGQMDGHHDAISICRTIYDQVCKRMLIDAEELESELVYLNTDRIHFREMERYFLTGCAGIYFMMDMDHPIDLSYEPEEWEE